MNKIILITSLLLFIAFQSSGQNAIAKIKYEDAELDFSNQNYAKALVTLTEVETLLGRKTPKVSHLKIMSGSKIIDANPYNDFELIKQIKDEATLFLKEYEDLADYEEKYREVYFVSEKLKKYPATLDDFNKQKRKAEDDAKLAEQRKQEKIRLDAEAAFARAEAEKASKIEAAKRVREMTRRHCTAWMFDYLPRTGFGISYLGIRGDDISIYFSGAGSMILDSTIKVSSNYNGKSKRINVGAVVLGVTFPLSGSLSGYVGAGLGVEERVVLINQINSNVVSENRYRDSEYVNLTYAIDAGLIYQVGRNFFVKSGFNITSLRYPKFSLGIGFAIRKDSGNEANNSNLF